MESDGRPLKKSTSPWVYVGCGCGAAVLLAMLGLAGLTWWGVQTGKEMAETMTDPKKREDKVRSVLPYDTLPEGYYPAFAMSMPMGFMEMAMLTDRDPDSGESAAETPDATTDAPETTDVAGTTDSTDSTAADDADAANDGKADEPDMDFDNRGFMFMSIRGMRGNKEKMERYVRGEAPRPEDSGWSQSSVNFDAKENVGRGTLTINGTPVLYSANRGEIDRKGGRDQDGLVTMVMPQCPGDSRLRFGMWFGPDPSPGTPVAEADFTGTNADPAAIQAFLGHFKLCGK
jgi:hypothetical protein